MRLQLLPLCSAAESNQYDVLVVIADKFLQMLDRNQLQASDTCVWVVDECHNATKDHPYAKVQ